MHVKVKGSLKQPQHFFSDSVIVQCSYETVFWDNITSRSEGILVFSEVQTRLYGTQTALERMERLTLLLSSEHRASSMKFGVWVNKQKKDETLLNLSKRDWYSNLLSFLGGGVVISEIITKRNPAQRIHEDIPVAQIPTWISVLARTLACKLHWYPCCYGNAFHVWAWISTQKSMKLGVQSRISTLRWSLNISTLIRARKSIEHRSVRIKRQRKFIRRAL